MKLESDEITLERNEIKLERDEIKLEYNKSTKKMYMPKKYRLAVKQKTTKFKNIRWNRLTGFWIGGKRWRGKRLHCTGRSALETARKLNKTCREHGCPIPNPDAEKITWARIERGLHEREAEKEMIAKTEEFIRNWKDKLPKDEIKKIFNIINERVQKNL